MLKKSLAALLAIAMLLTLAACGADENDAASTTAEPVTQDIAQVTANVITLKGPTGMGMSKMIHDASDGCVYTVAAAPDEVSSALISGSADFAACPLNLAAVLNAKTNGGVQIVAINTLGVMYIMANGFEVNEVADLKGKTIYASGQGSSPEFVLNYILDKNGLNPETDLNVEWLGEHAEVAAKAVSGAQGLFLLPEPNVTTVLAKNADVAVALNLTEQWNKISDVELAQGCLVVRTEFAKAHPETVAGFIEEYRQSVDFVNSNQAEASAMIEEAGIVPSAAIAQKSITRSNIVFITGSEMMNITKANLQILFDANPKSVGGAMPDDSFYYAAQ